MNLHYIYRLLEVFMYALLYVNPSIGQSEKPMIYLIPGQGSDYRIFKDLEIDSTFEIRHIDYTMPADDMTLPEYARELSSQMDTTKAFILIGVSLGGMIATEMTEFMHPEKVIIISSAKCLNELPRRYKFQRKFPIYKAVSPKTAKKGAKVLQPIVEPDRRHQKETFKSMLNDKDPIFLNRTIKMIMEWDRTTNPEGIIHIHGDRDHTIPIRNVQYDYRIEKGSHMMVLTRAAEIGRLLNQILLEPDPNAP